MASALNLVLFFCGISGLLTGSWSFEHGYDDKDHCCPKGWTQLNDRCLIFHNVRVNFVTAERFCNSLGGNLVSIHNQLENEIVRQLILEGAGSNERTWIGLQDTIEDLNFIWTDGTLFDFDDWAPNRPRTNDNGQDCVEINFNGSFWNDRRCGPNLPFVCAMDSKIH
ncbi:galactose-specific lectin nattectin-like [Nerophis lumbriciformis]|uniref:galactose-specific lectin nattectin-like n=1 Tax=Nerophis lumbriciformis TaxID=546530 RepID=UPI002ADF8A3D|nr:galactose-specific lectin nattectin-like [Nerophis lumbriciformis]